METITLKLTKEEYSLIENSEFEWSRFAYDIDLKVDDVDKFREFLNNEMLNAEFHRITNPRKYYLMKADNVILKSILYKLDKAVDEDYNKLMENIHLEQNNDIK